MTGPTNGFKAVQNGKILGKSSQTLVPSVCFLLHLPSTLQLPIPTTTVTTGTMTTEKSSSFPS